MIGLGPINISFLVFDCSLIAPEPLMLSSCVGFPPNNSAKPLRPVGSPPSILAPVCSSTKPTQTLFHSQTWISVISSFLSASGQVWSSDIRKAIFKSVFQQNDFKKMGNDDPSQSHPNPYSILIEINPISVFLLL